MGAPGRTFKSIVRHGDLVVAHHCVHGMQILPGVALLETICRAAIAAGFPPERIELRDVLFLEAIAVTDEFDRAIEISIRPIDGHSQVLVRSQKTRERKAVETEWTTNARCELHVTGEPSAPRIDPGALKARAIDETNLDGFYARLRRLGVSHKEFMMPSGRVYRGEDFVLAEIALSPLALPYAGHFHLHPALLDFSTGISFFSGRAEVRYREKPFIPIHIAAFRAIRALGGSCFVLTPVGPAARDWVDGVEAEVDRDEKVELYTADGELAACVERISFKKVREPNSILRAGKSGGEQTIKADLVRLVARALDVPESEINEQTGFYQLGLESTHLLDIAGELEKRIGQTLYPTLLFEYPTIAALAAHLSSHFSDAIPRPVPSLKDPEPDAQEHYFDFRWVRAEAPGPTEHTGSKKAALLVLDRTLRLLEDLKTAFASQPILVTPGREFRAHPDGSYEIDPARSADYRALLEALRGRGLAVSGILHLWSYDVQENGLNPGLRSVFEWSKALIESRMPARLLFFHDISTGPRPAVASIAGFAACLSRESPQLHVRLVGLDQARIQGGEFASTVFQEWADAGRDHDVRHLQGKRYARRAVSLEVDSAPPPLRREGVYLITGGLGGLGLIFAEHLAKGYQARLVLVGRSEAGPEQRTRIAAIEKLGGRVLAVRADVTDPGAMTGAVRLAKEQFGALHGVIHAAGVLKDGLIATAGAEDLEAVLAPKATGTLVLDEATKDEPLDFFALFSSLSGFIGSVGQSFYASANRYMDAFAEWRETMRAQGERQGRSVSLCWPLWADGGMQPDPRGRAWLRAEFGMEPLETAAGIRAFERALAGKSSHVAVVAGDGDRIRAGLGVARNDTEHAPIAHPARRFRKEDVAIIGMSGRYPQAGDLGEFWRNLSGGRDCIVEIPPERWDYRKFYDPSGGGGTKTNSKWGGFIADVDKFEPLLFEISPREAEWMDPQERLFLETAWACLEDAGYTGKGLSRQTQGAVGVFAGVMWGEYQLLGLEARLRGEARMAGAPYWSIANRVSYCFDFNGPSLAVDSACSSSLAAIHLACESLRRGECRAALAGGVNLMLHPSKYLLLAQMNMLSGDGRCRSFGEGGTGYVPGEGVGAVLLKPLEAAVADGDPIHAVIKGSAMNHDGGANGFTVPNPNAQAKVIETALERAGVDARTISYLEAHGTGTSLGDPVEIAGLTRAFRKQTPDRQYCAIGSAKSVIGHLEAAAGIAAVTKVVLQIKRRKLAPSLHAGTGNPGIDFENSPFRLQRELADWARPLVGEEGGLREYPRRAGISSFGAGGTNAHLVIEEFDAAPAAMAGTAAPVLPLSARNADRLRAIARRLLGHLQTNDVEPASLLYTLQTGREHLEERLAILGNTVKEIIAGLEAFLDGVASDFIITGRAQKHQAQNPFSEVPSPEVLARRWVAGRTVDWQALSSGSFQRVSLPTYPFAGKRYWIPGAAVGARAEERPSEPAPRISLFRPVWIGRALSARAVAEPGQAVALFDSDETLFRALKQLPGMEGSVLVKPGDSFERLAEQVVQMGIGNIVFRWKAAPPEEGRLASVSPALDRLVDLCRALLATRSNAAFRLIHCFEESPDPIHGAAAGFLKSLQLETPRILPQVLGCEAMPAESLARLLADELAAPASDFEIQYRGARRAVREMDAFEPAAERIAADPPRIKPQGVYVITGGAGGVGMLIARHLAERVKAKLVLIGRAARKTETFAELERLGSEVLYLRADTSRADEMGIALNKARSRFGRLDGVIHCAGITRDGLLRTKTKEDFNAVLAPKVRGSLILDELTKDDRLDFFCFFSSVAAVMGNPGQCDYAAANGFMDAFARLREHWRARGFRNGKSVSINWPLWLEGGMRAEGLAAGSLVKRGIEPLPAAAALEQFEKALALLPPQVAVLAGDTYRCAAELNRRSVAPVEKAAPKSSAVSTAPEFIEYLGGLLARLLKLEREDLQLDAEVQDFGMDSIVMKEFVQQINADCGDVLDPLAVLQKNSIRALAEHLAQIGAGFAPAQGRDAPPGRPRTARRAVPTSTGDIAVIGMACRFPQAENLDEFWRNIQSGRRSIREVPPERWALKEHFAGEQAKGKSYSKWGGFIDGIGLFDPEFFGLTEEAAAVMDPLHRLFLEVSARAVENAGYSPEDLRRRTGGVFVGAKQGEYAQAVGLERLLEADAANAWRYTSACMIARRAAEYLDLRGPSVVVDTACSSSLVSIHMACESLRRGECEFAIAGGAELLVGPSVFIHFSQSGSLSPDGVCRPFESRANGTVLGEGGGAVVLKPLESALADGDNILAVIKASAMNNEGANPTGASQVEAMKAVMRDTYRASGLSPADVGYIELHGEGSLLRDAVELRAIKEIWEENPAGRLHAVSPCPIGSVKANIGHLLLASGVSGFIKACLMLNRRGMPPNPEAAELARYAGLAGSPYGFLAEATDWNLPPGLPSRVVGINSTGVAGTNCFMLCADSDAPPGRPPLQPRPMRKRHFWLAPQPAAPAPPDSPRQILEILRSGRLSVAEAKESLSRLGLSRHAGARKMSAREALRPALEQLSRGEISSEDVKQLL